MWKAGIIPVQGQERVLLNNIRKGCYSVWQGGIYENLLLASCTIQVSQITLLLQKGFLEGKVAYSKSQPNTPSDPKTDAKDRSSAGGFKVLFQS